MWVITTISSFSKSITTLCWRNWFSVSFTWCSSCSSTSSFSGTSCFSCISFPNNTRCSSFTSCSTSSNWFNSCNSRCTWNSYDMSWSGWCLLGSSRWARWRWAGRWETTSTASTTINNLNSAIKTFKFKCRSKSFVNITKCWWEYFWKGQSSYFINTLNICRRSSALNIWWSPWLAWFCHRWSTSGCWGNNEWKTFRLSLNKFHSEWFILISTSLNKHFGSWDVYQFLWSWWLWVSKSYRWWTSQKQG